MVALIKRKLDSGYINIRQSRLLKQRLLPGIKKKVYFKMINGSIHQEKRTVQIFMCLIAELQNK